MIDRFRSIYASGNDLAQKFNQEHHQALREEFNINRELVASTNSHPPKMKDYITKYRRNVGHEDPSILTAFKQEQTQYAHDRNLLKGELDKMEGLNKKDSPQYNFIKKQLLRAVKTEIDLDLELNQEITRQKEEKEKLKARLHLSSPLLTNALKDIESKRADILYLEQQINECLQLLEIIGILTNETGQKLDEVSERVRLANENIERAEANIDQAVIAMQKSRCRMCCIIILSLIAIILVLVVLYGVGIFNSP